MCKILGQEKIQPHKVRYYLERRDTEFEQKMAEVLCVYREVQVLKKTTKSQKPRMPVAIVSYCTTKTRNPGHCNDGARFVARARHPRDFRARS